MGDVGAAGRAMGVADLTSAALDQICAFTSDFDRGRNGYSPDRVDALVWALTELTGPEHISWRTELR